MKTSILSVILGLLATTALNAALVASSQADFSGTQGYKNWYYGYYTAEFDYTTFTQYDSFNTAWGNAWNKASTGIGYGFIGQDFAYPGIDAGVNKDAVRRWVSTVSGPVELTGYIQKQMGTTNEWDNGVICRILINGNAVFDLAARPGTNNTVYYPLPGSPISATLSVGDKVDFVLDAYGNPGNDRTDFLGWVTTVPEPGMLALLSLGGLVVMRRRRA